MRYFLTVFLLVFVSSAFADTDGDGVEDTVDNCPEIANSDQSDADVDGRGDACDLFTVEIDNRFPDPLGIKVKVRAPEDKTISHYSFRLFHYGAFDTCYRDFIRQGGGTPLEDTFTYSLHPLSRSGDYALGDFRITTGDGEQIKEIQESYSYPIRIENSLAATEPVRLESWAYFADPTQPNRLGIKATLSGVVDGFKEELYSWDYDADQPRIGYKWTIWKNDDSGEWIQRRATRDNIVEIADRLYEVTSYFDMPQPIVDAPKIIEFAACDQTLFKTILGWDSDADGDLAYDVFDAFPDDPEEWYDNDGDGTGDQADLDDDDDNVIDSEDAFPLDASESKDSDGDGVGDNADEFPADASESEDTDLDEVGNNADNCPDLANADQLNTDGDSEGDACDFDDDNDGFTDEEELADGTNPLSRFSCKSGCFSFDIDESSEAKALTDGLLVIRHLFGFTGDALATGAISAGATRNRAEDISTLLADADSELDIDGNGESKALSDGLLLIRYLFGFTGDALTVGAIGEGATRDTSEAIEAYISDRVPASE